MSEVSLVLLQEALVLVRSGVPAGDLLERLASHTEAVWPGCRLSLLAGDPPRLQVQGPQHSLSTRPGLPLADGPGFDRTQRRAAQVLVEVLAEADARAGLFRQVLRSNAWLARLDDLSRAINRQTDVASIVAATAGGLGDLFGVDALGLYLLVDDEPTLVECHGQPDGFPSPVRLVGADGRLLLGQPTADAMPLGTSEDEAGRHRMVALLHGQGGLEGLLVAGRPAASGDWEDDAIPLVHAAAGHLATAVRNAHLVDEMRRLAAYDDLTGLAGRRHFQAELDREFDRARRESRPLSVLMLDLDHFKAVNDTFGHAAGDAVLVAMAEVLRHNTRTLDVVGRLGGEEFGVLLPGADAEIAALVAERLRAATVRLEVPRRDDVVHVTISVGSATWDRVSPPGTLLEVADQALYHAKRGGRNRVVSQTVLDPPRG